MATLLAYFLMYSVLRFLLQKLVLSAIHSPCYLGTVRVRGPRAVDRRPDSSDCSLDSIYKYSKDDNNQLVQTLFCTCISLISFEPSLNPGWKDPLIGPKAA